jgi:aryl-alcohol dehydrogenase-like predicted oxidoreductase
MVEDSSTLTNHRWTRFTNPSAHGGDGRFGWRLSNRLVYGNRAVDLCQHINKRHRNMNNTSNAQPDQIQLSRRSFVGMILAGGTAVLAGPALAQAASLGSATVDMDSTFKLGGDLPVSRLGFGAMRITGEGIWGWPSDRQNALKVLRRAVELGVNLIDTADAYGPEISELLIAEALYPYPKDLVIATKGGLTRPGPNQWVPDGRPEHLKQCVGKSLKRLRVDRIDLYQLHRIDPKVPMEDSLGALKEMRDAGKIRHIGLSEVSVEQTQQARKIVPIVSVQNQYNISSRKWETVLKYCEKEGLGFMPWAPIGGNRGLKQGDTLAAAAKDFHATEIQLALAWLLHHSPVMLPIPGTSSVAHLEENMGAAKLKLGSEQWQRIDSLAT